MCAERKYKKGHGSDQTIQTQESPRTCAICTNSACGVAGGTIGIGWRFCGSRQLSRMPTCCTHETVHRAAQNFLVELVFVRYLLSHDWRTCLDLVLLYYSPGRLVCVICLRRQGSGVW